MNSRYCPNCKTRLDSFNFFFCRICGEPLGDQLSVPPRVFRHVTSYVDSSKLIRGAVRSSTNTLKSVFVTLNLKEISLLLIFFLCVGVPLYFWMQKTDLLVKSAKPVLKENIANPTETISEKEKLDYASFVPYDVDFYFENGMGNEFALVAKGKMKESTSSVEFEGVSWGVLLGAGGMSPEDIQKYKLESQEVEGVLLLSNDKDFMTEMVNAKTRMIKNLKLNPIFVLSLDENSKTNIFFKVFSENPIKYVNDMAPYGLPDNFNLVLKSYLEKNNAAKSN